MHNPFQGLKSQFDVRFARLVSIFLALAVLVPLPSEILFTNLICYNRSSIHCLISLVSPTSFKGLQVLPPFREPARQSFGCKSDSVIMSWACLKPNPNAWASLAQSSHEAYEATMVPTGGGDSGEHVQDHERDSGVHGVAFVQKLHDF